MSIKALGVQKHVHALGDDLESLIYVVLNAALRWLPVESSIRLNWWIKDFFGAPDPDGLGGGTDRKLVNAINRRYTSSLYSTKDLRVLDWLRDAMDLHYKDGIVNPLWNDGKTLKTMWEGILGGDLPSGDRCVNKVPDMKIHDDYSLHATYTVATSAQNLYRYRYEPTQLPAPDPLESSHSHIMNDNDTAPQPSKRLRTGNRPQTRSVSAGNRGRSRGTRT